VAIIHEVQVTKSAKIRIEANVVGSGGDNVLWALNRLISEIESAIKAGNVPEYRPAGRPNSRL